MCGSSSRLRFRPVLGELPPGPAAGPPGQRQSTDPAAQEAAARARLRAGRAGRPGRSGAPIGELRPRHGWTGSNVGKQVAMVVKSRVLTAPQIQAAITDGATQITGKFTLPEAQQLARDIAGA